MDWNFCRVELKAKPLKGSRITKAISKLPVGTARRLGLAVCRKRDNQYPEWKSIIFKTKKERFS